MSRIKAGGARRWSLFALLLAASVATSLGVATPALAAAPCYGSTCDGLSPLSSSIKTGCGTPASVGGASTGYAVVTVLYFKTCHAAYAEMVLPNAGTNIPQDLLFLYQPPFGGPEQEAGEVAVSTTVWDSHLVSWDYSAKGCFVWDAFGSIGDPDPVTAGSNSFCTPWL
jgi:hypothetical protein